MAMKGYHSYRGRSAGRKGLLVAVLVLILLAACAYIFMQRYITYTDDGKLRLDLPIFLKEETATPPPAPAEEEKEPVNLVVDEPEPTPPPEEPVEEPYGPRKLVELKTLPADAAALAEAVTASGANGFAYQVKDSSGLVRYTSSVAGQKSVDKAAASTQLLTELCAQEGITSVAKLNCFHDSYYAWSNMENAGICQTTGYIWYDNRSWHWLDPDKADARRYVIDLALECAQLGFDELLLEEMCYPSAGKLQKIDYSKNTLGKPEALSLFLTELRTALEPYDVKISLLLDERLLTAEGADLAEKNGQDLRQLLPLVDAVYAPVVDGAAAEVILAAAAGDSASMPLVPMASAAGVTENWYITAE